MKRDDEGTYPVGKNPRETEGPIVPSGPTKGKKRARRADGRWGALRTHKAKDEASEPSD